jgi:hypothetical protein
VRWELHPCIRSGQCMHQSRQKRLQLVSRVISVCHQLTELLR